MKKSLLISIIVGIILLILPLVFWASPKVGFYLNYFLTFLLVPIIIYFSVIFVHKIKENNKIIHWSLIVSFIGTGLFLFREYLFYLFFGMAFKSGIILIYYILPSFLFPLLLNGTLLREHFTINNPSVLLIGNLLIVFVNYFILGAVIVFIISKIRKK